ncbi:hypothetical protein F2P56_003811 [Juglans regia]|uniref:Integrase zinc-binding domain-containing protein n=2 Tax=Juglans regia TaxID=51240 RepID=A0A833Y6Z7_JUGRE|nr:uncharacterized protein LOC108982588 [Juglans regia]KAF5477139.1 hypothetical protein F2P56_003811 [Juglans regia]
MADRMLETPAIGIEVSKVKSRPPEWRLDVIKYLDTGELPDEKWEVRKVKNKATYFTLIWGVIHSRFLYPLLRCVSLEEALYILADIHEGVCGNHFGERTILGKAMRMGYYWPRAFKDAEEFVRKCTKCQLFATILHCPLEKLT